MKAAVANGADAVYFGLDDFNARRRAENFTSAQLGEVMDFLHDHNVRGYLAMNTLLFPAELDRAAEMAARAARCGVDAVIVQDMALANLIHRLAPELPLHASTQMALTGPRSLELARRLGIRRVILPRETTLEQMARLAREGGVEVEVFVHGALCVSYSGQCLASLVLCGRRSANRGQCAQPCRMPYRLVVDGEPLRGDDRPYVLSPKDLRAWDLVGELVRAGVSALKIEGRLKGPHYVAAAVQAYRAALDACVRAEHAPPLDVLTSRQEEALEQSFSRGFTHGFLRGGDHGDLVDGRSPKSRGAAVGVVVRSDAGGVVVDVETTRERQAGDLIRAGDGVVFEGVAAGGQEIGGRVYGVRLLGTKGRVLLTFANEADLSAVRCGAVVRRTDDPRLERELEISFARSRVHRPSRLDVCATARPGEALTLRASDDEGNTAVATGDQPLSPATRHALTAESLREQLDRLGDAPFVLGEVKVEGKGAMAPRSVVNRLRREVVAELMERRRAKARRELSQPEALADLRAEAARELPPDKRAERNRLHVLARSAEQVRAVLEFASDAPAAVASVYVEPGSMAQWAQLATECRAAGLRAGLATTRITGPNDGAGLRQITDAQPDCILVRSLEALEFLRPRAGEFELVGDFSLNAANELAVAELLRTGLARTTVSLDLAADDLVELAGRVSPGRLEVLAWGRVPLFHTAHCLFAARLARQPTPRTCGHVCRERRLALRDYRGADHPVRADVHCRNTVFAAEPGSRLARAASLGAMGIGDYRLEFLDEDGLQVRSELDRWRLAGR